MSKKTTIGIIGCGNISDAYFKGAARSAIVQVKGCADLNAEAAKAKAYGGFKQSEQRRDGVRPRRRRLAGRARC